MGLLGNPNVVRSGPDRQAIEADNGKVKPLVVEFVDLPQREAKRSKNYVGPGEVEYLDKLMAAHGTDYTKMFRDMKRNWKQHTAAFLQKHCEKLIAFRAEQEAEKAAEAAAGEAAAAGSGAAGSTGNADEVLREMEGALGEADR